MSEIKVNKITPRTNCGTTTLGDSGDTINIPAGVTISNDGTATGFGATGAVNWDVASIKTVDFTAVSGVGYFVDTATTGAVEVTLPAAPAVGDVVGVSDYANNFETANCTLNRNSLKIGGASINATLKTDGVAITLVYVDVTKGWIVTDSGNQSDAATPEYVAATGGCITTCGNYKMHTFLSPGTFTVSAIGNCAGSNTVDYLVLAGGGGGGDGSGGSSASGGGGGAGGYRESPGSASGNYSVSPRGTAPAVALPVAATGYSIVIGGGGATNVDGNLSSFSTISSAGGGRGGNGSGSPVPGNDGGSGGGGNGSGGAGGNGNVPSVSPAQGFDGAPSPGGGGGGAGGGGATAVGTTAPGGAGGAGGDSSINGTPTTRGVGGTGAPPGSVGAGASAGANTGSGGNGGTYFGYSGGTGGPGIVIIRYQYQ
jgi:hypothetical protein